MKLSYDPRYNIAYIRFRENQGEVETIQLSDELNVDITPDGLVYGIELLNANEQLRHMDAGKLILVNEATSESVVLPLALGWVRGAISEVHTAERSADGCWTG
ncbi:MAG TPA: DUF2283 domain-containing protein [Ardenticatenaceae bacterium]|nr:DUF2283 domain-containing protein [Ardenticatenaceae bacterium]